MSIEDLRAGIGGTVYLPGDAGYDQARLAWNRTVEQNPQVIVDAETAVDVQLAVRFARSNDMPIGVMATGHGLPRGCDGVLIRTSRMRGVKIDAETRLARVQGGAFVKDVLRAAQTYGLAMLSGSSTEVGVVGYTLGGGFGLMIRHFGLAIDRMKSVRIVTPDGRLVTASETENPDLFWALRGGGGAFGVVVELTLELIPQATVFGGAVAYPADQATSIVRAYSAWAANQPETITSTLMLMNLPPLPMIPEPLRGRAVVMINACVSGDLTTAEDLVAPLRSFGEPIVDCWGAMPYAATDCIYNDPTEPMPSCIQGAMLSDFDAEAVERLLTTLGGISEMPQLCVQIRHIEGAMNRVALADSPVATCRVAKFMLFTVGVPNPFVSLAALLDHASGVFEEMGDRVLCRGPLNFIGEGSVRASTVKSVFAEEEFSRLESVKRRVDPSNLFRFASVGLIDED